MRIAYGLIVVLAAAGSCFGQGITNTATCHLELRAPGHGQRTVLLYRHDDLITNRTVLLAQAVLDASGRAAIDAPVDEVTKALMRIGPVSAELYLAPDANYELEVPLPDRNTPRGISGTSKVDPTFHDLDPFDVNALTSDLNGRIDAFLTQDLATDQASGMVAADRIRSASKDSLENSSRPPTLFVLPTPDQLRIDTFELKLRRFYAEAKDPWFWNYLHFAVAGLRLGPNANMDTLFERTIKGRPIIYNDPEQLRYLHNFFSDHLMVRVYREDASRLKEHILAASADSMLAMLAGHEGLNSDARLRELMMMMELYGNYHGRQFDRGGIERILAGVRDRSPYAEHRAIAANMLWDLTAMSVGSTFPSMVLRDLDSTTTQLDDLLQGAVCVAITAGWCTHCEVELGALQKLHAEYGDHVRFVVIGVDSSFAEFSTNARAHPERTWTWLYAGDDPQFMDALRLRSVPAYFLLNDRTIARNPAPLPSQGMAALFHKLKTEAEEKDRIKFGNEAPPPRR